MIDVEYLPWLDREVEELQEILRSHPVQMLIDHLAAKRDAEVALAGLLLFSGQKGESDKRLKMAKELDSAVEVLGRYVRGEELPSRVKIITRT